MPPGASVAKKRVSVGVSLAPAARQDVREILRWSEEKFGKLAQERYRALLKQALSDIEADPELAGSKERLDILRSGVRTYHLSSSRRRVKGTGVKDPRHFILYQKRADGVIEVGRVLHDGCDLERHVPEDY